MKNILFIIGLIFLVSLVVVGTGYFLYSQAEYVSLRNKTVNISENDDALLVKGEEGVIFSYSIEEFQETALIVWDDVFGDDLIKINEKEVGPEMFTKFIVSSPFPGKRSSIIFSVSTDMATENVSLFWVLDITTGRLTPFGEKNIGRVGNIMWSPDGSYFAYFLNTKRGVGEYLVLGNAESFKEEFILSGEDILEAMDIEKEDHFMPGFRGLRWSEEEEELLFMTDTLEEGASANWSINFDGTNLERVDLGP